MKPWMVVGVFALVMACGGGSSSDTGDEGQDCYPNDTCNAGLGCVDGTCVVTPTVDASAAIDATIEADATLATPDAAVADASPPDAALPDGATADSGTPGSSCNPVSQTGCAFGQKCAVIVDQLSPFIGHVGCAADGADAIGEACTEASAVGTADSCMAGGECYNELCHQICTTVSDSCSDGTCQTFVDGLGNPLPTELCLFSCDPLAQDCAAANEGCYLARAAVCVRSGTAAIGAPCTYANNCVEGAICIGSPGTCRALCGPFRDTWTEDADGLLQTPNCCGSGCMGISNPCAGADEACWPIIGSSGEPVHETAGFCISDADVSSTSLVCDCANAPTVCTEV